MGLRTFFPSSIVLGSALIVTAAAGGTPKTFGFQFRGFGAEANHLLEVAPDGGHTDRGIVFSTGGVFALAAIGETLYGAEAGPSGYNLITIEHVGTPTGSPVGPIGFPEVEGMAYCEADEKLYGASFDFASHRTTLIEINPATGAGTAIGTASFDVFLVGLACSTTGTLYGVSKPWGTLSTPILYTIERASGAETAVGALGATSTCVSGFGPIEGLAWDSVMNRLVGGFYTLYEIDTSTGAATSIGGDYTTATECDGVYGLAHVMGQTPVEPSSWSKLKSRYL